MENYKLIAKSIWRSGFIKDKNKIRQEAKEKMRRLIAYDLSANLINESDKEEFLKACNV